MQGGATCLVVCFLLSNSRNLADGPSLGLKTPTDVVCLSLCLAYTCPVCSGSSDRSRPQIIYFPVLFWWEQCGSLVVGLACVVGRSDALQIKSQNNHCHRAMWMMCVILMV